jgi:hypothetical protein
MKPVGQKALPTVTTYSDYLFIYLFIYLFVCFFFSVLTHGQWKQKEKKMRGISKTRMPSK